MRAVAVLVAWVLAGAVSNAAAGQTQVVFTIDVESNNTFGLLEQLNATCLRNVPCGMDEFERTLAAHGWPATFFLNVYEQQRWGEAPMRALAQRLQQAGHDVALHTHPHWMYDPNRWAMHQYSLEEQTRIVAAGARLLESWTDQPVVAHRAGAYAADANTLTALSRNGIRLDSSVFWSSADSRLGNVGLPRNLPGRYGDVNEIPVSVYERHDHARFVSPWLDGVSAVRKIDPNWYTNADEVRSSVDALLAANVPVLVVFLHSFSFMSARGSDGIQADDHALAMFRVLVEHLATHNLPVVTMRTLATHGTPSSTVTTDVVPRVDVSVDMPRFVWRRLRVVDSRTLVTGVAVGGVCLVLAMWLARRALILARINAPRRRSA